MDNRRSVRLRVDRPAQITVPGGQPIPCRIVDISETGAKLRPSWRGALPDRFDLRDMFTDIHRAVLVVWRGIGDVGVRFLDRCWERDARTGFGRRSRTSS
jgi:hypothetical protein